MVDVQKILGEFWTYFRFDDKEDVKVTVGEDGKIHVQEVQPNQGVLRTDVAFPNFQDSLPFQFGEFHASLILRDNNLTGLTGCPDKIYGRFVSINNHLTNLVGSPSYVSGRLKVTQAIPLKSLDGFPDYVGEYAMLDYHKDLPLLRTLNCKDGVVFSQDNLVTRKIETIIEKYKGQGKMAVFDCQKDLEDYGFPGNARW